MITKTHLLVTAVAALLDSSGVALSAAPPSPGGDTASPEALKTEILALAPARLVWREIEWRYCLLDGIREARAQKRPILLWAFINADPGEERC